MPKVKKSDPRVTCHYQGKVYDMNYIPYPKQRFSYACMRIHDNSAWPGYVVEGEKVYAITRGSRMAKIVTDDTERARVLADVGNAIVKGA